MKTMIVGASVASFAAGLTRSADKDDVASLTEGAISIARDDTGELVSFATGLEVFESVFSTNTKFRFVTKKGGVPHYSPEINPYTLKFNKQAYQAAQAKVVRLGYSSSGNWALPADANISSVVGKIAAIRIVDLSVAPGVTNNQYIVDYTIKTGDTNATIQDALVAKLGAYVGKVFASVAENNSGTNFGISFTGIANKKFTVHGEGVLESSPVVVSTPFIASKGLGANLLADEQRASVQRGYNDSDMAPKNLYAETSLISPTGTYVVYTVNWFNPDTNFAFTKNNDKFLQELSLVIPSGATNLLLDVDKVFAAILANGDSNVVWR